MRSVLAAIRLGWILALVCALGWVAWRPRQVGHILLRFFVQESGPLNLAIFRVVVFWLVLVRTTRENVDKLTSVPESLRNLPLGWEWVGDAIPLFDARIAHTIQTVAAVAAALALVGLSTRVAAPVATLGAVYVLGLPNFFTKINHGGHILVWCAAVLSASECHHAISLDALFATRRNGRPRLSQPYQASIAYCLPLRLCWLLFGVAYFFPGFYKTWEAGDLWITGEALRAHALYVVAKKPGFTPLLPLYHYQSLALIGGVGTLLFELGFVFLLFSRRFWWGAPVLGTLFHLGVKYLIGISFMATLKLYVCFLNFEWVLGKVAYRLPLVIQQHLALPETASEEESTETLSSGPLAERVAPAAVVGGFVIVANLYAGYAKVNSWPFSVFPLFSSRTQIMATVSSRNVMVVKPRRGQAFEVEVGRLRGSIQSTRWMRLISQVLEEENKAKQRELLMAAVEIARRSRYEIKFGDTVAIYRYRVHMDRDSGTRSSSRGKLLLQQRVKKFH